MTLMGVLLGVRVTVVAFIVGAAAEGGEGIRPFNGTSLEGWQGDLTHWSVEGGEIVGRSTAEKPLSKSTYLVWQGDMPMDFDLRYRVRISGKGANSGVHYRSRPDPSGEMRGPQADLDVANAYTGVLYEGLGRGLMSARGEQVEWSASGKRVVARFAPDEALRKVIRADDWNDFRVEARGTRIRHWINGVLMSDVTDGDASRFPRDGQLALQLHQGPPMEVRFKDLVVQPIEDAPPASAITVPEGFAVDLLASAQPGQGSWVCLAFDPQGRAVISPQRGGLLQATIPGVSMDSGGAASQAAETVVTPIESPVSSAQGLCFVDGALFVQVAEGGEQNGLWRLRDADGNGSYESAERLVAYGPDGGEHGPHAVVQGPDGALYVAIGNHTRLPEAVATPATDTAPGAAPGSPYDHFGEDLAGPRMWDPRGHAVGVRAPGGVVLRVDPATGATQVMAGGFRNAYDHCFNAEGELFTYDSDMEWDIGAPWYRAPRIVHVVRGGEYGWRSGSGCWPDWFADSLPPVCETDSASPTGMVSGHESAWPDPWRSMIYAADWTFGRILAVTLSRQGATYSGSWQLFASGRPMPVADLAWGPDGQMYLVTGGRGTRSGLYRIRRTAANEVEADTTAMGDDSTQLAAWSRRVAESMMQPLPLDDAEEGASLLLELMGSDDRWVRFAARTALEHQPTALWAEDALALKGVVRMEAALALARVGNEADAARAVTAAAEALEVAGRAAVPDVERITAMRAVLVAFDRHPSTAGSEPGQRAAAAALARACEAPEGPVAWAGLEIACERQLPGAVPEAMRRLAAATQRSEALRYATMLRAVATGWTDELRAAYWAWLAAANADAGGFSLAGFLDRIRADAAGTIGGAPPPSAPATATTAPRPVSAGATLHAWTVEELLAEQPDDGQRDLARGARVFQETSCVQCHRFAGMGASTGPDLTGVGARFSRRDLLRAILEPNAEVSDQYRDSIVETDDGSVVVGRIVSDSPEAIEVRTNPMGEERERVLRARIVSIAPLATSSMPPGLLSARTRAEVLDLLAYLERGGSR